MYTILDNPVWTSLTTRHAAIAKGDSHVKRYLPDIVPFIASVDDSGAHDRSMADLVGADERLIVLQSAERPLDRSLQVVSRTVAVQMVAVADMPAFDEQRIVPLAESDSADMLALASLTRPGPFSLKAQSLGQFWGVKQNGRLVAMAGQRLAQPGYVELSGVCVHPDIQGQGLGRLVSRYVAGRIGATGDLPYLHCYATNASAIALYRSIGFEIRCELHVTVIARAG